MLLMRTVLLMFTVIAVGIFLLATGVAFYLFPSFMIGLVSLFALCLLIVTLYPNIYPKP